MKVATNPLPPAELLHELLRYHSSTGYLHYRQPALGRARDDITRPAGSITVQGYRHLKIEGTFYCAHRLIWHMMVGPIPQGHYLDHRNNVRDDTGLDPSALDDPTRTNLRTATPAQNAANRDLSGLRECRATLRGVARRGARYQATLFQDYAHINLGTFDTEQDAHLAYRGSCIYSQGQVRTLHLMIVLPESHKKKQLRKLRSA